MQEVKPNGIFGMEILYGAEASPDYLEGVGEVLTTRAYFQMSVMGDALRSFAVRGSNPKLSSMVRSTL
jgi:hypothetical protein